MIDAILFRDCPSCGKVLEYSNKYSRYNAEKVNSVCRSCSITKFPKNDLIRYCPKCEILITYSISSDKRKAEKANTFCSKCTPSKSRFKIGIGSPIKSKHSIPMYDLNFLLDNNYNSCYF